MGPLGLSSQKGPGRQGSAEPRGTSRRGLRAETGMKKGQPGTVQQQVTSGAGPKGSQREQSGLNNGSGPDQRSLPTMPRVNLTLRVTRSVLGVFMT